jgi:uncharacterized protein (TIGR00369 family)
MPQNYLLRIREPQQTINPWFALLGLRLVSAGETGAVLALPFRPELNQGAGVLAGGLLATLLDEAMAHALLARLAPGQSCATIGLTVNYLRTGRNCDLTCRAEVDKMGSRVAFASAQAGTEDGLVLATATASFSVFPRSGGVDRSRKEG